LVPTSGVIAWRYKKKPGFVGRAVIGQKEWIPQWCAAVAGCVKTLRCDLCGYALHAQKESPVHEWSG
jgi:hypothetical protein